jgi:hypothetical protein
LPKLVEEEGPFPFSNSFFYLHLHLPTLWSTSIKACAQTKPQHKKSIQQKHNDTSGAIENKSS